MRCIDTTARALVLEFYIMLRGFSILSRPALHFATVPQTPAFCYTTRPPTMDTINIPDHALIGQAAHIPTTKAVPTLSINPIEIPSPGRIVPLQARLTLPISGTNIPIILLSHGQGSSNNLSSSRGYGPLVDFWASHGFAVIQATHLSSKLLSLDYKDAKTSGTPMFWRERVEDLKAILDHLGDIDAHTLHVAGRLDRTRIAVAGHSAGGHAAEILLGMKVKDPETDTILSMADSRIKAGLLLATLGNGDVNDFVRNLLPVFQYPDFSPMTTPALVVAADDDVSTHLTDRGADWHMDPYTLSPGPKDLFVMKGGWHILGGISGWDAAETKAEHESPERVAAVQRLTVAYLRSTLYKGDGAWAEVVDAMKGLPELGTVEHK